MLFVQEARLKRDRVVGGGASQQHVRHPKEPSCFCLAACSAREGQDEEDRRGRLRKAIAAGFEPSHFWLWVQVRHIAYPRLRPALDLVLTSKLTIREGS